MHRLISIMGLIFLLLIIGSIDYSLAEDDMNPTWMNSSNITGVTNIREMEPNTLDETIFITSGGTISVWGIHNESLIRTLHPDTLGGLRDMEWNDDLQLMAWVHDGSMSENPSMWWSQLVIFDLENPINAFEPYGNLPYYQSTIIEIAWRPRTSHIGIAFSDFTFRLYDIVNNTVEIEQHYQFKIKQFSWNPSGSLVSFLLDDNRNSTNHLYFLDISQNNSWYSGELMNINDIDWSFDGRFFFMSTSQGVRIKDVSTWESTIIYNQGNVFLSSHPLRTILAIHGDYGIDFFNYSDNSSQRHSITIKYQSDSVWSTDGLFLLTVSDNDIVRIWMKESKIEFPTIGILSPSVGSQVSGIINITGWAFSHIPESLIVHIQVGYNDWILLNGTSSWAYQYDTRKMNDGLLKIRAKTHDLNGYSDICIIHIYVSNEQTIVDEPPSVLIEHPANGTEIGGVLILNGSAKDDRGIISVQVRLGNDQWTSIPSETPTKERHWSFVKDISFFIPGPLAISVRSFDGIHFSEISQRNVIIGLNNINNSKLKTKIIYPERGEIVGPDFNLIGIVENGIAESVYIKLDYAHMFIAYGTSRWNLSFINIEAGPHTISAIAINATEVSQWYSTSFYVDDDIVEINDPPMVGIHEPLNGQLIRLPINIVGWSYDDIDVDIVEIKINTGPWQLVNGTTQWYFFFNNTKIYEGDTNISVRAFDGKYYSDDTSIVIYNVNPNQQPIDDPQPPENPPLLILLLIIIIILIIIVIFLYYKYNMIIPEK